MKARIIFGALVVSVTLVGQGFGLELLNDLLGINHGCNACCEPQCCEQACAPNTCAKACVPATCGPKACEPACAPKNCCEPACCEPCCKPRCDLFAGLKGLFACKKCCCEPCGNACCEDVKCCTPEPKCCGNACAPKNCCEPACAPKGCCEPTCGPTCGTCCRKHHCTPIRDLIDDLCSLRICIYSVPRCNTCCEPAGCCEDSCGGCGTTAPATNGTAPAKDLPTAPPIDDASASVRTNKYYKISRSIVRN